ncbi:hypothetical protein BAUCODRAFT_40580, partial [Baudoinia panamericana UAMH 10762]
YHPLDPKKREFRVLRLGSVDDGDPLYFLDVVSLETRPKYRALSYVWGNGRPIWRVSVNGQFLNVRWNLYTFLETMLDAEQTALPIFIDAICIDQGNIEERGMQVTLMGEIYKSAQEVVVWLGD